MKPSTDKTYLLPFTTPKSGRIFPKQNFTTKILINKRFHENTSPSALTISFILPFLNKINSLLDNHVQTGENLTIDEINNYIKISLKTASFNFLLISSNVVVQTSIGCFFIIFPSNWGNSLIYLWDSYPKIHEKYIGDLFENIKLPRWLAQTIGPKSPKNDVIIFNNNNIKLSIFNSFEDSLKRNIIPVIGSIVVQNVLIIHSGILEINNNNNNNNDK
eukprot:Tbor_TRINITY_DN2665_c0_g1::TRINITY_DN2665_c0_g1_i1::g.17952::m.17952